MRKIFLATMLLFISSIYARNIDDFNRFWQDDMKTISDTHNKYNLQTQSATYTLTVQCANYNKQNYSASGWRLYGGTVPKMGSCAPNFKGTAKSLAAGKYCFIATFFKRNLPGTSMVVIAKELEIKSDTTITLDPVDTDKDLVFRSIYPDGSSPVLPTMPDDFEQTGELDYSKANTKSVFWTISIDNDEFGHVANFGGSMSVQSEDGILAALDKCGVSVTELGNNWHISMTRFTENLKNEFYVTHSSINGTSEMPLVNKPDFIEYTYNFAENPVSKTGNKGIPYEIIIHNVINGFINTPASAECSVDLPKIFLSKPMGKGTMTFNSDYAVELKKNDAVLEPEPFWFDKYGIITPPVMWDSEADALVYSVCGGTSDSFNYWQGKGALGPVVIPGNRNFAAPTMDRKCLIGGCAPVAVTSVLDNRMGDKISFDPSIQWLGIYSEVRQSDVLMTDVDLRYGTAQDAVLKCKASELADTVRYLGEKGLLTKECEIIWNNDKNIKVGDLSGFNRTSLLIKDVKASDINPPSFTMMQFRNSKNEIDNMFDISEGALLEVSGGDFMKIGNEWLCIEPIVKAEIAHEHSEQFHEIEMSRIESNFVLPSFGYFWRGKLDQADTKGAYTLRISISDTEGNTSVQTIYPAFTVARSNGVDMNGADRDDHVKYYDLQGMPVIHPRSGSIVISVKNGKAEKIKF